jgi:nucleotide-binding universal stress UspA family protein
MTMKFILAPISGTETDGVVLHLASLVARRFAAHIEVLHARSDPRETMPYLGEGASPALIDQVMVTAERDAASRSGRAKENFDAWVASSGIGLADAPTATETPTCSWRLETGAEDKWISRLGRLSDMTIVAQPGEAGSVASMLAFEAALLDTGRPVMLAPIKEKAESRGIAVVAWNGSAESAHALSVALPFLAAAKSVHVVAVEESAHTPDAEAVMRHLAWHRIASQVRHASVKGRSAAQAIMSECEAVGASLLVMGGYTHNRLRQMIFGGVTAHVLKHANIPVLLAH